MSDQPVAFRRPTISQTPGKRRDNKTWPCPRCRSWAGYLIQFTNDDPTQGYTLVECGCKAGEHEQLLLAKARRSAALDDGMGSQTFEAWNVDFQQQGLDAARRFAQRPRGFLVLAGPPGTGKTHLLAAIANALLSPRQQGLLHQPATGAEIAGDERVGVEPAIAEPTGAPRAASAIGTDSTPRLFPVYCVAPRLANRAARAAFERDDQQRQLDRRYFDSLLDAGVLLLDDLGAEWGTELSRERIFELVDWRYANRRPTVIATNVKPDQLPDRLRSRILDQSFTVVALRGNDYRLSAQRKDEDPW